MGVFLADRREQVQPVVLCTCLCARHDFAGSLPFIPDAADSLVRIATGRGRKPTYVARARARIVAIAQRQPDRRADGTATWSLSTLQRTLRKSDFPKVGTSTIRRVLQDAGSSYQRTRTWCPTGTAQRKRKAGVVTVVDPQTEVKRGSSNSPTESLKA